MKIAREALPPSFAPDQPGLLREILWRRGLRTAEEVSQFLSPSLVNIPVPHETLKDLREAIQILLDARERKLPVVVFGDYDVDGATSTTLLMSAFRDWGFSANYFIPHRVTDGYGVTLKAAKRLCEERPETKVVVTCDCGVASFEGIEYLKSKNIAVVVTDHHEVPDRRVAADAVINPKQKGCAYPDKKLAGVGVAFLLLIGLRRALDLRDYPLSSLLDLVALGTVCDVAELVGVNRAFVRMGLQKLGSTNRPGLRVMLRNLALEGRKITARDLGFLIGPRLNAAGRVGEPTLGVRSLMAQSESEAQDLVDVLEGHNRNRKDLQDAQLKEAVRRAEILLQKNPTARTLVIADPEFHLGVVGLLAARVAEAFQRPTCVMTELKDEHALADFGMPVDSIWKGSLRTPPGYHLADALKSVQKEREGFLLSGGGHAAAAGVAVSAKNISQFPQAFEKAVSQQIRVEAAIEVDAEFVPTEGLSEILSMLEPFGNGNPPPLFWVRGFQLQRVQVMKEVHLKLFGQHLGQPWSVLQFKSPWVRLFTEKGGAKSDIKFDFLAELSENEWNGNKKLELVLKDLLEMRVDGDAYQTRRPNEVSESQGSRQAEQYPHSNPA